jgi:XTP/dITP diphosphohydrolase
MPTRLLVATRNPGKAREYRQLLADLPVEVTWLEAEGIELEIEETGGSFEENAILKASGYARASGLLTWADDSGLEVDYLGGWPGVASARHAGPHATDQDRIQILLEKLMGVPFEQRAAVFRCVVALSTPDGRVQTAVGSSSGVIAHQPAGENGFGYDPIFFIPKFGCTYAQLAGEEKHSVSHRGRAAKRARLLLQKMVEA